MTAGASAPAGIAAADLDVGGGGAPGAGREPGADTAIDTVPAFDLDAMHAVFAAAPFIADLGVRPTSVGAGRCTSELTLQARHLQHTGQVHAGVSATLADHTMGAAAQGLAPAGRVVVTAELKVSLLRAARGERLVCEARVIKPGRTLMFTEAEVYAVDGAARSLTMKASATMALTAAPAPAEART